MAAAIGDASRAFTPPAIARAPAPRQITAVAAVAHGLELRRKGIADLCMSEEDGVKPDGFDFGNSPHGVTRALRRLVPGVPIASSRTPETGEARIHPR